MFCLFVVFSISGGYMECNRSISGEWFEFSRATVGGEHASVGVTPQQYILSPQQAPSYIFPDQCRGQRQYTAQLAQSCV